MPLTIDQFYHLRSLFTQKLEDSKYYNKDDVVSLHVVWNCLTESSLLHPLLAKKMCSSLLSTLTSVEFILTTLETRKFKNRNEVTDEFLGPLNNIKTSINRIFGIVKSNEEVELPVISDDDDDDDDDDDEYNSEENTEIYYRRWSLDNPYDPSYLSSPVVVSQMLTYCCSCILRQIDHMVLSQKSSKNTLLSSSSKTTGDTEVINRFLRSSLGIIKRLIGIWKRSYYILKMIDTILCECQDDEDDDDDDETKIIERRKPKSMDYEEDDLWGMNHGLSNLLRQICKTNLFFVDNFMSILDTADFLIEEYRVHTSIIRVQASLFENQPAAITTTTTTIKKRRRF